MLNWKEPSIYFESITKVRLSNRELCIDIEKDKTEPWVIPTENSALLYRKRQDWIFPLSQLHWTRKERLSTPTTQRRCVRESTELVALTKRKTEPIPTTANKKIMHLPTTSHALNRCTFPRETPNSIATSLYDRKQRIGLHYKRKERIHHHQAQSNVVM